MEKELLLSKLGKRIKTIREKKGLSQTELGYKVDKDQQSIQRLESGRINPSYIYLYEISLGLEIDLNEIIISLKDEKP